MTYVKLSPSATEVFEFANLAAFPATGVASVVYVALDTNKIYRWVAASAEAVTFLARTTGLDTAHTNAYTALIDGLVADGIWSKFDVLYILAAQDSTTALLNLIGNIYNGTLNNAPAFTADRGFLGATSGAKCIKTGFVPSTASSPKFTRNSAHHSVWCLTELNATGSTLDGSNVPGSAIGIHARWASASYFVTNGGTVLNRPTSTSVGHFLANRSDSSTEQGYVQGVSVGATSSSPSAAVNNKEMLVCGENANGTLLGNDYQLAAASIGASLNSTEVAAFYNRLRTYMTAVGVP